MYIVNRIVTLTVFLFVLTNLAIADNHEPQTYFYFNSETGDYIGGGQELTFETADNNFTASMHQDGSVFFSSTTLGDHFVIRIAIVSFRSKLVHADLGLKMIGEALKTAKGESGSSVRELRRKPPARRCSLPRR